MKKHPLIHRALTKAYRKAQIFNLEAPNLVVFSDQHRGNGSHTDDFAKNSLLYQAALKYYATKADYHLVEAGDAEDLWESVDFGIVHEIYSEKGGIYELLLDFHKRNRLTLIWGNHNRLWKNKNKVRKFFDPVLPGIKVYESVILQRRHPFKFDRDYELFLLHGHQGQILNDQAWWVGRFFVRNVWKVCQSAGWKDPTKPSRNIKKLNSVEEAMVSWVSKFYPMYLITGHTHRPFVKKIDASTSHIRINNYLNSGCCIYPHWITCLELNFEREEPQVRLVLWTKDFEKRIGRFNNVMRIKRKCVAARRL